MDFYESCTSCLYYKEFKGCIDDCFNVSTDELTLEMLIRAMWAINKDNISHIIMHKNKIIVRVSKPQNWKRFDFSCHDNEQQTLSKAVECVVENM